MSTAHANSTIPQDLHYHLSRLVNVNHYSESTHAKLNNLSRFNLPSIKTSIYQHSSCQTLPSLKPSRLTLPSLKAGASEPQLMPNSTTSQDLLYHHSRPVHINTAHVKLY